MVQGRAPGVKIHKDAFVVRQEDSLDFATLFLGFFEDKEFFVLIHDANEAKQNTFLQAHTSYFRAVKSFFDNGGRALYLLNYPPKKGFDAALIARFLEDHCDNLNDLETLCPVGLIEGLLSQKKISEQEALQALFAMNTYAAQTDRISMSDINEEIRHNYLDMLGETVIYHPWFKDKDGALIPPSSVVAGIASRLAFEGKFFHSSANKSVHNLQKLSYELSKTDLEELHQEQINPIIYRHIQGLRVWGVKVFNSHHESVNEMRVLKYIKRQLKRLSRPYLFEGNTEQLHDKLFTKVSHFLTLLWESGALAGHSAQEAFEVNTSILSLDNTRTSLVVEVSVAISKPLEFIVIRLNRVENNGAQESLSVES